MADRYGLCADHEPWIEPYGRAVPTCRCNPLGERPVSLTDELDDLVSRVVRRDGDDVDARGVWLLVLQWALYRAGLDDAGDGAA